jgi:hypothetical protein
MFVCCLLETSAFRRYGPVRMCRASWRNSQWHDNVVPAGLSAYSYWLQLLDSDPHESRDLTPDIARIHLTGSLAEKFRSSQGPCEGLDWIRLAQDMDQCLAPIYRTLYSHVPRISHISLTIWTAITYLSCGFLLWRWFVRIIALALMTAASVVYVVQFTVRDPVLSFPSVQLTVASGTQQLLLCAQCRAVCTIAPPRSWLVFSSPSQGLAGVPPYFHDLSRCGDWPRASQSRVRISSPAAVKHDIFPILSSTQPLYKGCLRIFPMG